MRIRRSRALIALAAVAIAWAPATALASAAPTASVVLMLRAANVATLQALASDHQLSRAQRAAALATVVPDAHRRDGVAAIARGLGLTVTDEAPWSVRVSGPANVVSSLFGRLPGAGHGTTGRAYPSLPAGLSSYVVAALPTSGRVAHRLAAQTTVTGKDFRTAYSTPIDTNLGAGFAIATVQLSGWKNPSGDLKTFAQAQTPPLTAPTYIERSIDGGLPRTPDGQDGDSEVALDQEAILSTAPSATQIAYFAPNDDGGQGYIDAVRQVGADVLDSTRHYNTGALSLSWGGCEPSYAKSWIAAMDQSLLYTVAAGVTVFGASGDQGSQDCIGQLSGSAQYAPAVDFPASSPYVVSVGGASLPDPHNPSTAKGWSDSGGGESAVEALPSWQLPERSVARHGRRVVPDIASDAETDNGFCVYNSNYNAPRVNDGCSTAAHWSVLGGTSLAAPTQAALLVATLQSAGWSKGVGDIHPALYTAPSSAFTDITTDETTTGNGNYHSTSGYDLVTGLGTPLWTGLESSLGMFQVSLPKASRSTSVPLRLKLPSSNGPAYRAWSTPVVNALASCSDATHAAPTSVTLPAGGADGTYFVSVAGIDGSAANSNTGTCHVAVGAVVLDRHAPRVSASIKVSSGGTAVARWSARDASPSSGLSRFVVTLTAANSVIWKATGTGTSHYFNALPHSRWHVQVRAYDVAGNSATTTAHLYDDSSFVSGSHWTRASTTSAYRHSYARTSTVGTATALTVTGHSFVLYVTQCTSCGQIGVYDQSGHRIAVVDTYYTHTRYRISVTILTLSQNARRTFVFRVLSTKNRSSHGRTVGIDGFGYT